MYRHLSRQINRDYVGDLKPRQSSEQTGHPLLAGVGAPLANHDLHGGEADGAQGRNAGTGSTGCAGLGADGAGHGHRGVLNGAHASAWAAHVVGFRVVHLLACHILALVRAVNHSLALGHELRGNLGGNWTHGNIRQ